MGTVIIYTEETAAAKLLGTLSPAQGSKTLKFILDSLTVLKA